MKNTQIIIDKVVVTEKGTRLGSSDNQYLFNVHPDANKIEIKQAVEEMFKVSVTKVNTMNRLGKLKRDRKFRYGRRASVKRAVVTLKEGDKIELT
ncbi:MAG TPA: 50S ribosomal protein L23 [Kiritimatiellia bacterium]|nr:50S ribosomal protein L23 [Kiritimatiellia bacterium]HMO98823.1 50S ribosomal protein L23 [Kiritimatiellia bacterium]HMP96229.1 50S ribosomal protein L23 [Kiritimatiellia bacterium]